MNQASMDKFSKLLGIPPEEQAILDAGSNHPFGCLCKHWWILMGPQDDDGERIDYRPFSVEEINAEKKRCGDK